MVRVIADYMGISLPSEYLDSAASAHARLYLKLLELREVPLPYLEPSEPMDAQRWIERGGRSLDEA